MTHAASLVATEVAAYVNCDPSELEHWSTGMDDSGRGSFTFGHGTPERGKVYRASMFPRHHLMAGHVQSVEVDTY